MVLMAQMKVKLLEVGFECEAMNRLFAEEVFLAKTKIKTCKCSFGEIRRTFFITLCRLQDFIDPTAVDIRREIFAPFAGIQKLELFSTM